MYYRLPQIRRSGQRISLQQREDTTNYEHAGRGSDIMEFGGDGDANHSPLEFDVCKGLTCPLD